MIVMQGERRTLMFSLITYDMGLLDELKGPMMDEILGMVKNQQGGLSGLVGKLKESGMADQVESWIGLGENKPVAAGQIKDSLGSGMVEQIAGKLGLSMDDTSDMLAKHLPGVIDKLTPNGKLESDDILGKGMDMLKGLFRK